MKFLKKFTFVATTILLLFLNVETTLASLDDAAIKLLPGDIYLTGDPSVVSQMIRFFTRSKNEPRTVVTHTGIIVEGGSLHTANTMDAQAHFIKIRRHPLSYYAGTKSKVAIFRPINLSSQDKKAIVEKAESYKDTHYGFFKIGAHVLDWFLGGEYLFRRLAKWDKTPICSFIVAKAYEAAGKDFNCSAAAAQPDDIMDFCQANPDKYKQIREFKRTPKDL